jgi:hypothetical protein
LFPFKDQIKEKTSQSLVVYKINCKTCSVDYIGKTERILVHMLKEHQKKKQTTNKSACYELIEENPTSEMDYENSQVIDRASSNFKLRMKELFHILKEQPELNKQLNSQSDYEIKTLIIQAYPQHRNETVATYISYTSHSYTYMHIKIKQNYFKKNISISCIYIIFFRI